MKIEILHEAEEELNEAVPYFLWNNSVWILAGAHGSRRPEYWIERQKRII